MPGVTEVPEVPGVSGASEVPAVSGALDRWEGRPLQEWERRWGVPRFEAYDQLPSTNDRLRVLAEAGAAHFTVVTADSQTAGKGRSGKGKRSVIFRNKDQGAVRRMGTSGEFPLIWQLGRVNGLYTHFEAPLSPVAKVHMDRCRYLLLRASLRTHRCVCARAFSSCPRAPDASFVFFRPSSVGDCCPASQSHT